ncbi:MAG: ComEC/Rec2 family competence protein [Synechococcus sp.]
MLHLRRVHGVALAVLVVLVLRGLFWGHPKPLASDPLHWLTSTAPRPVELIGRLIEDARPFDGGCSGLLAVRRLDGEQAKGRTQLLLRPCPAPVPLQGWSVSARGLLQRPSPGGHPLVIGSSERLARRGSWTQLKVQSLSVLHRPNTPLVSVRRRIGQRFISGAGPDQGALLAALVLGSAQVSVPEALRESVRVAGLSHALAASGFHLSVLLGASLALTRRARRCVRLAVAGSMLLLFLLLAGAQPSVVRAVLMGAAALLIREADQRSHGLGVLLTTLIVMLLLQPAWATSLGFQFSAAATAGLVITAPAWQEQLSALLPARLSGLSPALAMPLAAMAWTLPLQLLHFGSTPLYALPANVLAAPLLTPLTLGAMALAPAALVLPASLFAALLWPLRQLAQVLIALVHWISQWPGAQLLTGHPQPLVVLLMCLGLLPWLSPVRIVWRLRVCPLLLLAVGLQLVQQLGDGVVAVHRYGHHWLLLRHQGRAALLSNAGDAHSCRRATRLATAHGHRRLDWVVLMDPRGTDALTCWRTLAHHVQVPHQGRLGLSKGQRLVSPGLQVSLLGDRGGALRLQVGAQRWWLFPRPQALWGVQDAALGHQCPEGIWFGFQPSARQRKRFPCRSVRWVWVATAQPGHFTTGRAGI